MGNNKKIVIDVGNTSVKSGCFVEGQLLEVKRWSDWQELAGYCRNEHPESLAAISVGRSIDDLEHLLPESKIQKFGIEDVQKFVRLDYKTPQTLGMDRVVAGLGAMVKFPRRNLLVIDLGTCITYDLIDANAIYRGGAIAPGLQMRLKALNQQTAKLPDLSAGWMDYEDGALGRSTNECIVSGTFHAIIYEIDGFVNEFASKFENLIVLITGGDAPSFESKIKQPIFADSDLILRGLNRMLTI